MPIVNRLEKMRRFTEEPNFSQFTFHGLKFSNFSLRVKLDKSVQLYPPSHLACKFFLLVLYLGQTEKEIEKKKKKRDDSRGYWPPGPTGASRA
jgi:hypothetical protein